MDPTSLAPQVTLLIENFKKSNNWGPLLRCCAAFGISQIFVVGFDKCSVQGSHGASKHVELIAFHDHQSAIDALKENHFVVMGLLQGVSGAYNSEGYKVKKETNKEKKETIAYINVPLSNDDEDEDEDDHPSNTDQHLPRSFPVGDRPFSKRTCLVVGKKTKGLLWSLAKHCDKFIHIPHCGPMDGSWLTIEAGVSIVLHEFAGWAGYNDDNNYKGQKYHVQKKEKGSDSNDRHEQRKRRREEQEEESQDMEVGGTASLFDNGDNGDY